jgi:choline transport protein
MLCTGSDSIVHISEEVEDASLIVPRAMWWSFVVNVFFGILMLVTMLFCIGPLEDVLESGVPYLTLFLNTGSTGMALFLTILVFLLIGIGNITCLATCMYCPGTKSMLCCKVNARHPCRMSYFDLAHFI